MDEHNPALGHGLYYDAPTSKKAVVTAGFSLANREIMVHENIVHETQVFAHFFEIELLQVS